MNPAVVDRPVRDSFSVSTPYFTPVATPTDIVQLVGFTQTPARFIKVSRFQISSTQTTTGLNKFFLIKRTTANTGGTITNPPIVQHDSSGQAPQAVFNQYSVNPTGLGTGVQFRAALVAAPAPAATQPSGDEWIYDDQLFMAQPIWLRSSLESLCLNFAGAAVPTGLSISVLCVWTEE